MSDIIEAIKEKDKLILEIKEKISKESEIEKKEKLIVNLNNLINEKLELSDIYYKYANIMNKNKITPINQSENLDIETDENIISKNKNEKKARKRKLDITDSSDKEDLSSGNEGYLKFNAISKKKLSLKNISF